ncbi:NHL repeat-containing protein [bacterium]|nr:NHL repeat-containing protein [bacterium]
MAGQECSILRMGVLLGLLLLLGSALPSSVSGDPPGASGDQSTGSGTSQQSDAKGSQNTKKPNGNVEKKELISPVRIAIGPDGHLLVSDYQARKVRVLHRDSLKVLRSLDVNGKPLGVAYANDRIFVGNETLGAVQIYTPGGKLKGTIGKGDERARKPTDMAIDPVGERLYVVDGIDKCVKVYDLDGTFAFSIPANPPNESTLAEPTGIAIDSERGEVLVSDFGDGSWWGPPRIQIFQWDGTRMGQISGKAGMMGSRFSRPQGLAVDGEGHILMTDSLSGEVFVFDRANGQTLTTIGEFGLDPGQLRLPLDLVVYPDDGRILVTNNGSARIEVFEQGGAAQ